MRSNYMYICCTCGEQFKSYNPNPQYCSVKCKGIAQRADIDSGQAVRLYKSGMTQTEVASELGTSQKVIHNILKRCNVKCRPTAKRNQYGPNNHSWAGGKTITTAGYIAVRCSEHPRASSNGYVFEHILVAEEKMGRPLKWFGPGHPDSEIVHHLNGDRTDNHPANLQITCHVEHMFEIHGHGGGSDAGK